MKRTTFPFAGVLMASWLLSAQTGAAQAADAPPTMTEQAISMTEAPSCQRKVPLKELPACSTLATGFLKHKLPAGTACRDHFLNGKGSGPEMVLIPTGQLTVGSEQDPNARPVHEVQFTHPIAVGVTEVTFDQWDACVADRGCSYQPADEFNILIISNKGRATRPVFNISRDDLGQYLRWLSARTGKSYRLLTEAEWEYVARSTTSDKYGSGNPVAGLDAYAWVHGDSQGRVHPVGCLNPNPWGLHDLLGNVEEWVQDCWHSNYVGAPTNGHEAWNLSCAGTSGVTRGGSVGTIALVGDPSLSVTTRQRTANQRWRNVGFRVARDYP